MDTAPGTWGNPGPAATITQKTNYSRAITTHAERENIDIVLIDGRFRVASCLSAYRVTPGDCVFLFDDFRGRTHYHEPVLKYLTVVETTADNDMALLLKKPLTDELAASLDADIVAYEDDRR